MIYILSQYKSCFIFRHIIYYIFFLFIIYLFFYLFFIYFFYLFFYLFIFLNKKFFYEHNTIMKLILVELRVIQDFNYRFYIIRAKMCNGVMTLYRCMSATRINYLYVSCIYLSFSIDSILLYGCIIGNLFEVKIILVFFSGCYQSLWDEYGYCVCICSRATD